MLVTGANGYFMSIRSILKTINKLTEFCAHRYVGGITIQKFLDHGYRVRGTVRDVSKYDWMLSHYGPNFSLAQVPDMGADGAMDEAVKDVDGIAHIAFSLRESFQPDPQCVIPRAIRCAISLLESAAKEKSVKSVIYTSSQAALVTTEPGKPYHISSDLWNEESKAAWTLPVTQDLHRARMNYMCAKTEAEQQSFKWVQEHKPQFTFNTVLPSVNFGAVVRPDKTGFLSSSVMMKLLWMGSSLPPTISPPQHFVDVEDTALLHVAVLTSPEVKNERVLAIGHRFCYNDMLDIFRKMFPDHKFLDRVDEIPDNGTVDDRRAEKLLKHVKGGKGWSTLEEVIQQWSPWMLRAEKEGKDWPLNPTEQMVKAMETRSSEQKESV